MLSGDILDQYTADKILEDTGAQSLPHLHRVSLARKLDRVFERTPARSRSVKDVSNAMLDYKA